MPLTPTPTRRTVVRGAAWATPAVALAATAPAFAASPCTTTACPNISFGAVTGTDATGAGVETAGNGWTSTYTSAAGTVNQAFPGTWTNRSSGNPVGFRAPSSDGGMALANGPWFAATAGPTTNNQRITLTQSGQPALAAGCAYQITIGLAVYDSATIALTLRTFVGTTQVGVYTTNTGGTTSYTNRGPITYAVPGTASGLVSFRFDFGAGSGSDVTADIKLHSPSIVCA